MKPSNKGEDSFHFINVGFLPKLPPTSAIPEAWLPGHPLTRLYSLGGRRKNECAVLVGYIPREDIRIGRRFGPDVTAS